MALPNLKEVEWAIARLEGEESSKGGYLLLSALYNIRDHMRGEGTGRAAESGYSQASAPWGEALPLYGQSDFLQVVSGKDSAAAWAVIDELMETLRVVNPRAYGTVMRKLGNL